MLPLVFLNMGFDEVLFFYTMEYKKVFLYVGNNYFKVHASCYHLHGLSENHLA